MEKQVAWLRDAGSQQAYYGEQAAKLGELYKNNYPVPLGFVVGQSALSDFMSKNLLSDRARNEVMSGSEPSSVMQASSHMLNMILGAGMPESISKQILSYYHSLETGGGMFSKINSTALEMISAGRAKKPSVSVHLFSQYPGVSYVKHSVQGDNDVIDAVKRAWAAAFSSAGIVLLRKSGAQSFNFNVVILKEVEATQSAVVYTRNPVNFSDEIVIESLYGWIEPVVEGEFYPDSYTLSKQDVLVNSRKKGSQKWLLGVDLRTGQPARKELSSERVLMQSLSDEAAKRLSFIAKRIETQFGSSQKIIMSLQENRVYITGVESVRKPAGQQAEHSGKELLKAYPVSPGFSSGRAKFLQSQNDYSELLLGDVIICRKPLPGIEAALENCSAVVTGSLAMSSRLAEFARSIQKPVVCGVSDFTVFDDNYNLEVDAFSGIVYQKESAQPKPQQMIPIPLNNDNRMDVLQPEISGFDEKLKVSLEVSSPKMLRDVLVLCKQYGIDVSIINAPDPRSAAPDSFSTPQESSVPEPNEEPALRRDDREYETPKQSVNEYSPVFDEVKETDESESDFSYPEIQPQNSSEFADYYERQDDSPMPLPQTIVERKMYEEEDKSVPGTASKDDFTIGDMFEKKKQEKKKDDEDVIPYW